MRTHGVVYGTLAPCRKHGNTCASIGSAQIAEISAEPAKPWVTIPLSTLSVRKLDVGLK